MMTMALVVALTLAGAAEPAETKADLLNEMTRRLLDGKPAPRNIETRLMALEPAERFEAVVFLRRSGLLSGKSLSVDRLLATEPDPEADK